MILKSISKFGEYVANVINGKDQTTSSHPSPSISALRKYFEHFRLHDLLPYRAYDQESGLFHNEDSVGFVIECDPMVGCSEEMQREISGLFQHTLPEGTNIQFMLWADPRIGGLLDYWKSPRLKEGGIFAKLAQKRCDFIESLVFDSTAITPLRNFRCIISFSQKGDVKNQLELDKITNLREQILTALKTLGVPVKKCDASDLLNFLDGIINFNDDTQPSSLKWNPYTPLNEPIPCPGNSLHVESEGLSLDSGKYVVRACSVR